MPTYSYRCTCGTNFERYLPIARYLEPQICECGDRAEKVILKPPMMFMRQDIAYESPIDGTPIMSEQQRREDLARSGCIEYDPMMRQDYDRRIKREESELDKAVDETVDRELAQMPARKREKLETELAAGFDAEVIRTTTDAQPIIKELAHV